MENTSSSNLQLFHILMDYGMRLLHKGQDFFELKNPIQVAKVELQKICIYNLKSIYEVSLPEVKVLPMEESRREEWEVTTRCFSIDWNIGLKQLTVCAESKLRAFFKTKFHPVEMIIEPLILHVRLRICFPFVESPQPSRLPHGSPLNLPHFATFSIDLEDVDIEQWKGVHIKGKGAFNKIVGFVVNSGVFTSLIRKAILKKVRKIMPQKFAALKEKIHAKVNALVNRTIERYAVRVPRNMK
ncbi:hypothetical protein ECG_09039 [Echinococcus granulosus]|nr:hypothetical protein ECG_09036 [Echinococcus granulosus]KAH9278584.1 hypothetical protein ECG_09039 [Echinococcus granulosus]CDS21359.1 hypothetical protein EgrG_000176500 [Echinococcus granulosus]CDS21362.1 hypothetical protein EgrG_000176800 [Echinococcus granulosus]